MKCLQTKRVFLRKFKMNDLGDFYEYAKNPNIGPNAGWKPHSSINESKAILSEFVNDDFIWAIVYKSNNKVIGSVGLHKDLKRNNDSALMIGYVLSEDYWNQGIMTEAVREVVRFCFEELHIDILSIYTYDFNIRSRRGCEKLGFVKEGVLRFSQKIPTGICDEYLYSMTIKEYIANQKE